MNRNATTAFAVAASASLMLFVGVLAGMRSLEGWGAWAAAPALIAPLLFSLAVVVVGLDLYRRRRERALLFWTLVGGAPLGWACARWAS